MRKGKHSKQGLTTDIEWVDYGRIADAKVENNAMSGRVVIFTQEDKPPVALPVKRFGKLWLYLSSHSVPPPAPPPLPYISLFIYHTTSLIDQHEQTPSG